MAVGASNSPLTLHSRLAMRPRLSRLSKVTVAGATRVPLGWSVVMTACSGTGSPPFRKSHAPRTRSSGNKSVGKARDGFKVELLTVFLSGVRATARYLALRGSRGGLAAPQV